MSLLQLEFLKLRRTLVWPVVLGLPLVPVVLDAFIFRTKRMQVEATWDLMLQNGLTTWWLLLMPLVVGLLTAWVLGLEHMGGGWRLIFAAPRPRPQVLVAKFVLCLLLLGLATGLVALTVSLGALTLAPQLGGQPDCLGFLGSVLLGFLGAVGTVALTFFVALRFSSFLAPLGVSVVGMVLGFIGVNSAAFGPWWPWTFPLLLTSPKQGFDLTLPVLFSLFITTLFVSLSLWDVKRREA